MTGQQDADNGKGWLREAERLLLVRTLLLRIIFLLSLPDGFLSRDNGAALVLDFR